MSTTLRGILILLFSLAFIAVIAYQSINHKNTEKRARTFLTLASVLFIFLDLSMSLGEIQIKVFNVAAITFLIFNLAPLYRIAKKYYLIIVYISLILLTSFTSEFRSDSLWAITEKLKPVIVFLVAIIAFGRINENQRLKLYEKYMKFPIFATLFFGIVQIFFNIKFSVFYSVWDKAERISSCFPDPQIAGCTIAIIASYIWCKYLSCKKDSYLLLIVSLTFIGLQTGSKVFLIGFILSILFSFIFTQQKTKYTIIILITGVILLSTQDYWSNLYIFDRLYNTNESLEVRQEFYWLNAIDIFRENWIFGIGSGVFQLYIEKHDIPMIHTLSNGIEVYASQPESGYLLWLDELGILSIIYIIILAYFIFKKHGNQHINISIIIPWLIAFVSLYNLTSNMLIYILFMTLALMVIQTENKKHIKQ